MTASRSRRRAISVSVAAGAFALVTGTWFFVPRVPPYAAAKRVRQVTGLPVPFTAGVIQSQVERPRHGARLIEFYELQLSPAQFASLVQSAGRHAFQQLPEGDAKNPAATSGWYHEQGSPTEGGYTRTVLDAARHRVRVMIMFT